MSVTCKVQIAPKPETLNKTKLLDDVLKLRARNLLNN